MGSCGWVCPKPNDDVDGSDTKVVAKWEFKDAQIMTWILGSVD